MRLPFQRISQLLEDSFNIGIASGSIQNLFRSVCVEYTSAEIKVFGLMRQSPKIHVDETTVNIEGKIQYVWVFTDGIHVCFRLTKTRESTIVHELLTGYRGVLVSDFYAGYDAVDCSQQKCWVHLIRDINEDLRKNPFDSEFAEFALALRTVMMPIFDTVNRYGLKTRYLNKFRKKVDRFYSSNIGIPGAGSEIVKKYQKRFSRYEDSLFTFLSHEDIPWNNNMAERALRHLAVQRKISGSFFESGMTDYLILLGIMQTCRFQNKSFLDYLMSGSKDVDSFKGKRNIKGWTMK